MAAPLLPTNYFPGPVCTTLSNYVQALALNAPNFTGLRLTAAASDIAGW
jgi:hypothetical protein